MFILNHTLTIQERKIINPATGRIALARLQSYVSGPSETIEELTDSFGSDQFDNQLTNTHFTIQPVVDEYDGRLAVDEVEIILNEVAYTKNMMDKFRHMSD